MKKIILHKNRCPLEATAEDGYKEGTIKVKCEETFISEAVDEFETNKFEAIKLKKTILHINKRMSIDKIIIKEKHDK